MGLLNSREPYAPLIERYSRIRSDWRPLLDAARSFHHDSPCPPGQGCASRALFAGRRPYFILLFDGDNGDLLAVIAGRDLNVWRTSAPAGVASRYLAPKGADSLGIIGSGRQAHGQLLAIRRALPQLKKVKVFSRTKENRDAFAKKMSAWLDINVESRRRRASSAHIAIVLWQRARVHGSSPVD